MGTWDKHVMRFCAMQFIVLGLNIWDYGKAVERVSTEAISIVPADI